MRALRAAGVAVASAKVGPDYIDPAFHAAATGRPCLNLDPWAMRSETLAAAAAKLTDDAELIVCEGVMGLFDGATASEGSTADVAAASGWPVVLVVDVRAQAASAAAVVRGFQSHRPDVDVAGVILNRVGGPRHVEVVAEAIRITVPEVTVVGWLPRDEALSLPERHLGLVQAAEHPQLEGFLDRAGAIVGRHVDLGALRALARPWAARRPPRVTPPIPPLGQRIAVAADAAFAFSYPSVLEGWRTAGAEVLPFSPLADEAPDARADAVYLPGGYPELHAGLLAGNLRFIGGLGSAARVGAAVFGECGGYMVLGAGLVDAEGCRHAMAGLLPVETSFADRRLTLGYRQVALAAEGPLGRAGDRFRGHEFHYARVLREGPGQALFAATDAAGRPVGDCGLAAGSVVGSFVHLVDRWET